MKPFPCTDDFDQDIEHPDDDATNSDADDDHINLSLTFCVKTRYQRARQWPGTATSNLSARDHKYYGLRRRRCSAEGDV
jgi:hypothetical protein